MVSVICFKTIYYIETDELNTRNFPFTKKSYPHRAVKILFLSFTCEDIRVGMVTNMVSQLQERFLTFWNREYKYYCLYNFISEFHNFFVTSILR